MGEILKNIKLIKMNCWEELFMQKVVGKDQTVKF